jgi:hypothetical protein
MLNRRRFVSYGNSDAHQIVRGFVWEIVWEFVWEFVRVDSSLPGANKLHYRSVFYTSTLELELEWVFSLTKPGKVGGDLHLVVSKHPESRME